MLLFITMRRINVPALYSVGFLFLAMISKSRNLGVLLRCHAFASKANRKQNHISRSYNSWRFNRKNNYPLVIRGGGSHSFSGNSSPSSGTEGTTPLSSTASPSRESSAVSEKDEFEKRVADCLPIASGGPIPTSINSFGGLSFQNTSSTKSSSLFRVVFVLGGPGEISFD